MAMCTSHKHVITPLLSSDYSTAEMEDFRKSMKKLCDIMGSVHLILEEEDYRTHMRDPTAVRQVATDPGVTPNFAGLTTMADIEQAKADFGAQKEAFCHQEGVTEALKTIILENVPESIRQHLEDNGYTHVTPLEMMNAIVAAATEDEAFSVDEQYDEYMALPDLEGEIPLSTTFAEKEKLKKKLSTAVPNPVTNHNAFQVKLLALIKRNKDFKDEVREWEARDRADRTWNNFKAFFADADKERRVANKKGGGTTTAGTSQFGANFVTESDIDSKINAKLGAGLAHITETVEEALAAKTVPSPSPSPAPPVSTADKKKIEELKNEIARLKKGRSDRRARQVKMTEKCPHCNRLHQYIPAERFWGNPNYSGSPPPAGWQPAAAEE